MIGRTIGHYRITSRLGGGAMGVVYKADDLKLGRTAALKFLPPDLTRDEEAKKRFLREAQSASLLDHPNICTIYDVDEDDGGQTYIAMACYDGETLKKKIEREVMRLDEAIRIVEQIARGLAKAHASGIVHRDIKPANVMVTSDGVAKIVDFGLAKLTSGPDLTRSHTSVGTAAYMSPEQFRGDPLGPQTDIWALGILLFELLTGKRPFRGEYAEALSYSILNEQPMTVGELRPDLPAGVDPIIKRMLRKDPLQRYQTAEEVIGALETLKTTSSGSSGRKRERIETERLRSEAKLGPYAIVRAIGSGGMGDVYLASDTRLDRQVAIKVLPPEFSEDAERKARFKREAKTISQLTHPNICTLFDIGEQEGVDYLVMEYLEGKTLAEMKLPLPLARVLAIASEIAEGLAAAHQQGVVHRDLTPANVMITKSGVVKLLDFGLAKGIGAIDMRPQEAGDERPLSGEGLIIGTLSYMAPEQIEGREADARTDIFAFGAVLYEMLTGKKAFGGKTQASIVGAIMHDTPPPISALQPLAPVVLDRIVITCMAKDPEERWQSVVDLKRELQWTAAGGAQTVGPGPARSAWSRALPWGVAGIFGVALVSALLIWAPWHSASPSTKSTLSLSRDNSVTVDGGIAISPDARTVAFAAHSPQGSRVYVRRLDEWEPRALPLTDGATHPSFSPDGRWIVFSRGTNLEKMPVSGGSSQVICKAAGFGGRWRNDGTIIFGAFPQVGLWRVSSNGGEPQLITQPSEGSGGWYLWPESLPGDRGILFTVFQQGRTSIAVLAPGADKPRILVESGSHPRYLPTGHLVYVADNHLIAVAFDVERLEVRGGATVVVDDVNESPFTSTYDVSANGLLVYMPAGASTYNIVWKDRQGVTVPVGMPPRRYSSPALSPDGQRLSVVIRDGPSRNIWTGGVANEPLTRLTFGNDDLFGLWSRDGARLFYTAGQNGSYNIFSIPTNGSGKAERLTQSPNPQGATSCSPSGDTLLFSENDPSTGLDIWELSLSRKESRPIVKTRFNESNVVFSPDGHWIAYQSNESGQKEVYVQAYPGPGIKRRVSLEGGVLPFWSHTGRELFYNTDTAMFAVPILDAHDLHVGTPLRLFGHSTVIAHRPWISADDQRFLMLEKAEPSQSSQLNLVLNWFQDLKARVPAK